MTWLPVPGEGSRSRLACCPRATRCLLRALRSRGQQRGTAAPLGSRTGRCRDRPGDPPGSPSRHLPPIGLWTFLWFIGFCFLTNQWSWTKASDVHIGADSARAAITFSFFSIFSWVSEAAVSPVLLRLGGSAVRSQGSPDATGPPLPRAS